MNKSILKTAAACLAAAAVIALGAALPGIIASGRIKTYTEAEHEIPFEEVYPYGEDYAKTTKKLRDAADRYAVIRVASFEGGNEVIYEETAERSEYKETFKNVLGGLPGFELIEEGDYSSAALKSNYSEDRFTYVVLNNGEYYVSAYFDDSSEFLIGAEFCFYSADLTSSGLRNVCAGIVERYSEQYGIRFYDGTPQYELPADEAGAVMEHPYFEYEIEGEDLRAVFEMDQYQGVVYGSFAIVH